MAKRSSLILQRSEDPLYTQVLALIERLNQLLFDDDTADAEKESSEVLERLCVLGETIANTPAQSLKDLELKTKLYRVFEPEVSNNIDQLSIEEKLVRSIIVDVEVLADSAEASPNVNQEQGS